MSNDLQLDHDVVARIVRRATELAGPVSIDDAHTGISRAALVAAADEVGLPVAAVLRSIAIEQLGDIPRSRLSDRLLGGAVVSVDDEIEGTSEDVLHRIDAWLVDGHHRRRDRLRFGRGEWSKRSGLVGVTVRRMRTATGEGRLGTYQHIAATVEEIGTGSSAVRVTVDRQSDRAIAAAGGVVVAMGGAGGIAVAAASGPVVLLAAPFVVLGGLGVALTGRRRARRTESEVQRLLEAVADHQPPTRLRTEVTQRVIGRRTAIGRNTSPAAPPAVPPAVPRGRR